MEFHLQIQLNIYHIITTEAVTPNAYIVSRKNQSWWNRISHLN